jgi:hypothetical protein
MTFSFVYPSFVLLSAVTAFELLLFLAVLRIQWRTIFKSHHTISSYCSDPRSWAHRFITAISFAIAWNLSCMLVEEYNSRKDHDPRFYLELVSVCLLPLVGLFYTDGGGDIKTYELGPWLVPIIFSNTLHMLGALPYFIVLPACNLSYGWAIRHQGNKGMALFVGYLVTAIVLVLFIGVQGIINVDEWRRNMELEKELEWEEREEEEERREGEKENLTRGEAGLGHGGSQRNYQAGAEDIDVTEQIRALSEDLYHNRRRRKRDLFKRRLKRSSSRRESSALESVGSQYYDSLHGGVGNYNSLGEPERNRTWSVSGPSGPHVWEQEEREREEKESRKEEPFVSNINTKRREVVTEAEDNDAVFEDPRLSLPITDGRGNASSSPYSSGPTSTSTSTQPDLRPSCCSPTSWLESTATVLSLFCFGCRCCVVAACCGILGDRWAMGSNTRRRLFQLSFVLESALVVLVTIGTAVATIKRNNNIDWLQ